MSGHPQFPTKHGFTVDEKLVELIDLLNDLVLWTVGCCQETEYPGDAEIQFGEHAHALSFLALVYAARHDPDKTDEDFFCFGSEENSSDPEFLGWGIYLFVQGGIGGASALSIVTIPTDELDTIAGQIKKHLAR